MVYCSYVWLPQTTGYSQNLNIYYTLIILEANVNNRTLLFRTAQNTRLVRNFLRTKTKDSDYLHIFPKNWANFCVPPDGLRNVSGLKLMIS